MPSPNFDAFQASLIRDRECRILSKEVVDGRTCRWIHGSKREAGRPDVLRSSVNELSTRTSGFRNATFALRRLEPHHRPPTAFRPTRHVPGGSTTEASAWRMTLKTSRFEICLSVAPEIGTFFDLCNASALLRPVVGDTVYIPALPPR